MLTRRLTPERSLTDTPRKRRRGRRFATWAALALLVLVVVAIGAVLVERRLVALALLTQLAANAGFDTVRFEVAEIDLTGLVLTDVRIGEGDAIGAERIVVAYRAGGLRRQAIDRITLTGLTLAAELDADGLDLGPLDRLLGADDTDTGGAAWRVGEVRFEAARLDLAGAVAAELVADGALAFEAGALRRGRFDVRGEIVPPAMAPIPVAGPVSFALKDGRWQSAEIELTSEGVDIPTVGVAEGHVSMTYAAGEAELRARLRRGDDRLAISALAFGPDDDVTVVDGVHAEIEASVTALSVPGSEALIGYRGSLVLAVTEHVFAVVAEMPLTLALEQRGEPVRVRIAASPEPFLTVTRHEDGPETADLRLDAVTVEADGAGAEISDIRANAVLDEVIRITLTRLRAVPDGIPGWTAPVVVAPTNDAPPGDTVAAERIVVTAAPEAIADGRVASVTIEGLAVALDLTAEAGVQGPLAPLLALGDAGGPAAAPALPVETVRLDDARLRITGDVPATLTADGEMTAAAGVLSGTFGLRGEIAGADAAPLHVAGPLAFTLAGGALQSASLALESAGEADPDAALTAVYGDEGLEAGLRYDAGDDRVAIDAWLPAPAAEGFIGAHAEFDVDVDAVPLPGVTGPVSMTGRGRLEVTAEGLAVTASEPLTLAVGGDDPLAVQISAQDAPFLVVGPDASDPEAAELELASADVTVGGRRVAVRSADATVHLAETPRIDLDRLVLGPQGLGGWTSPVTLSGIAEIGEAIDFRGRASTRGGRIAGTVSGRHSLANDRGSAEVRLEPLRFEPGTLQPAALYPELGDTLEQVYGRVTLSGTVSWTAGATAADLTLGLDDLSFTTAGIRFSAAEGTVRFDSVDPLATPPGQELRIARIDLGTTAMTDALIRFDLQRDGRIRVATARFDLLGGSVVAEDFTIDPDAVETTLTLDVEGIDVQAFLDVADMETVAVSGRLSGRVPITLDGKQFAIDSAQLETQQAGTISYQAAEGAGLDAAGEEAELVARALRNFQYDSLTLSVDGGSGAGWEATARIAGRNPEFLEGQPFVFNVNLSGDIEETIRGVLFGYKLRDVIEKHIFDDRR